MPAYPCCSRCAAQLDEDELFPDSLIPSLSLVGSRTVNISGTQLGETVIRVLCRMCFTFLLDQIDDDPMGRAQGLA